MSSFLTTTLLSILFLIFTQTTNSVILEAPKDKVWFGAWVNITDSYEGAGDGDSPVKFNQRMGFNASMFQFGQPLPNPDGDKLKFPYNLVGDTHTGTIVSLTIQPTSPWTLSDDEIKQLYDECQALALDQRKVLIRFGAEMNGSWFPWGQRPVQFINLWKRVYSAFTSLRYSVQFVWAPNFGQGYPFSGNLFPPPDAGSDDFKALDTNHDGVVDDKDDPYSPYYPGDDFVDWVGISVYYFGPSWPWIENVAPKAGSFEEKLTYFDFYNTYAVKANKPLMIAETAAAFHTDSPGGPGDGELAIQQAWWRQYMTNTTFFETYPQIKAINIFEFLKREDTTTREYRISFKDEIRNAFLADFASTKDKFEFATSSGVTIGCFCLLTGLSVIITGFVMV